MFLNNEKISMKKGLCLEAKAVLWIANSNQQYI